MDAATQPEQASSRASASAHSPGVAARYAVGAGLSQLLLDARKDTLATFAAWQRARPDLRVPEHPQLNPPLWELGHVGWFAQWWIGRNPQRALGVAADPLAPRRAPWPVEADALYNSTTVPHAQRWHLRLPSAAETQAHLQAQLEETLALLGQAEASAAGQYFFRLALLHEDMHHEAALYMAQALGVPITDPRWQAPRLPEPPPMIEVQGGPVALGASRLGASGAQAFAFDNELGRRIEPLEPFRIDAQVLRWAEFLPFAEDGAYTQPHWWTADGNAWREANAARAPRYLRKQDGLWQQYRHGQWQVLNLDEPACHLTAYEAQAWCAWAGRRLPSEAQWLAAATQSPALRWGDVWEWTASPFAPFEGFTAHPYRDYSAPWFDGRPVLKGASFMTQPRMRHLGYRNFFAAERNDVAAGFRSCASP
jgi:gamma-glutamyl hercynylcysteine S-oxide synthase